MLAGAVFFFPGRWEEGFWLGEGFCCVAKSAIQIDNAILLPIVANGHGSCFGTMFGHAIL